MDAHRRIRPTPPPPGWYLPDVAATRQERDSFDGVEGRVIEDGPPVEVLNGVSPHGGLVGSWPVAGPVTAQIGVEYPIEPGRASGLAGYAPFANDTISRGPHGHPDVVGRASRLCPGLGVVPVFVAVRERGSRAMIEHPNGLGESRAWARSRHETIEDLQGRSRRHVTAHRRRGASRIESAPARRAFPRRWRLDPRARPGGRIVPLRRTNGDGAVEMLGRTFEVDKHWLDRLARAEVDLEGGTILFHRLRRREPPDQPLLSEVRHRSPDRLFHG